MEEQEYCALCDRKAVMQCDSDQAKLCWKCDERVHSANFLVAKHLRVLLCRVCLSRTTWKGSGPKLTPTIAVCHQCIVDRRARIRHAETDDDDDDDDYDNHRPHHQQHQRRHEHVDDDEEENEEGENQVVPMSSASESSPPGDSRGETGCSSSPEMVSECLQAIQGSRE